MEQKAPRAVIFDLGRVILDFDHNIAAQKIYRFTAKTPNEIYQIFFDSDLTVSFEEGKISPFDFYLRIKELLALRLGYEDFVDIWNSIFFLTPDNLEVYSLAIRLSRHYPTLLLSNINLLHLEYIKKEFSIFDAFNYIVASCKVGAVKPKPVIYKQALELLSLPAEDVFYTDDRPELVQAAKELGINSSVYKGPEKLREDLLGLRFPREVVQ